jgi:hypothetical protein
MKRELLKAIFIGGTGRSGTSILKTVLQQHSKIVTIPNELRIIIDPDGILDLLSALTERWSVNRADVAIDRFDRLISKCCKASFVLHIIRRLESHKNWLLTKQGYYRVLSGFGDKYVRSRTEKLMRELIFRRSKSQLIHSPSLQLRPTIYEAGPFDREELIELLQIYINDLYSNVANSGETCWLDDTPLNILHATELSELFKDMKLIHIYRDPLDVVSSYFTKIWGGDEWKTTARRVAGIYGQWHRVCRRLSSKQFIEISLEKLSANPKANLQRICDHIGVEFEERLLDIKLKKTNSGRWKQDIPPTVLETIRNYLDPFLSEYGSKM